MATQTAIFPRPGKVNVQIWEGDGSRIRLIRLDDDTTIHIPGRPALDALQAALDEIRADMDAQKPDAVAEPGSHDDLDKFSGAILEADGMPL